jgi:hypothetical protein
MPSGNKVFACAALIHLATSGNDVLFYPTVINSAFGSGGGGRVFGPAGIASAGAITGM